MTQATDLSALMSNAALDTRIVAGICIALTWITVGLRVYVRGFMIRSFGWDDWLMLAALVSFTAGAAIDVDIFRPILSETAYTNKALSSSARYAILELALYILASIFLKLSLALYLLRVVQVRWQRLVITTTVTIYTIYATALLFICIFQCGDPVNVYQRRLEGRCLSWKVQAPLYYVHAGLNAGLDWTFAILPVFVIRNLKMPRRAKITVCSILALGALGSLASLVRIAYIDGLNLSSTSYHSSTIGIGLTSLIEPALGIVAGSLATLRPLLRHLRNKSLSMWTQYTEGSGDNSRVAMTRTSKPTPRNEFAVYGFAEDLEAASPTPLTMTDDDFVSTGKKEMEIKILPAPSPSISDDEFVSIAKKGPAPSPSISDASETCKTP